jgi:hypothetical protein
VIVARVLKWVEHIIEQLTNRIYVKFWLDNSLKKLDETQDRKFENNIVKIHKYIEDIGQIEYAEDFFL